MNLAMTLIVSDQELTKQDQEADEVKNKPVSENDPETRLIYNDVKTISCYNQIRLFC